MSAGGFAKVPQKKKAISIFFKVCIIFTIVAFAVFSMKYVPSTPAALPVAPVVAPVTESHAEVGVADAVRAIISAFGDDRSAVQRVFREAGAASLVQDKEVVRVVEPPKGTGIDAPFDYRNDERAQYGFHNYESRRANENYNHRRQPCSSHNATIIMRRGVDILTDFVEFGFQELGCPLGPRCMELPTMPEAKKLFLEAVALDPHCHSALLNAASAVALGALRADEDEIDKYITPLVRDESVHKAMQAKAWLLRGVVMERLGRSPAAEYDHVRRLWPRYCIQYSSFKCDTKFFPWRLLTDNIDNAEGREAESSAVLRILLAAEYQTIHLGMMSNVSADEARQFPTRQYIKVAGIMQGYALKMHQYSWLHLIGSGALKFGDPQVPLRYGRGDDAPSNIIRGMLNEVVEMVMGMPIKPTYSYFGGYRTGSVLKPHTDRLACEFTMSVMLYSDPPMPWPFLIDGRPLDIPPAERGGAHDRPDDKNLVNITLHDGDAGLIRGRRVIHFRDEWKGNLLLQQFHHFVFDDFPEDMYGT